MDVEAAEKQWVERVERMHVHGYEIPEYMHGAIARYIVRGIHPGSFLSAVFENNLLGAVMAADVQNMNNLPAYAALLYDMPIISFGDRETVEKWRGLAYLQDEHED